MAKVWMTSGLMLAGLLGLGTFGYSLTQQTAIQSQMNQTMNQINVSIATTGGLVAQTVTALKPLYSTTSALANIEIQQQSTISYLKQMNQHLQNLATLESSIVTGLDNLNQATQNVSTDLTGMAGLNNQLLNANGSSVIQANSEAAKVGQLSQMTNTSISQLHQLNGKLSGLKALP